MQSIAFIKAQMKESEDSKDDDDEDNVLIGWGGGIFFSVLKS